MTREVTLVALGDLRETVNRLCFTNRLLTHPRRNDGDPSFHGWRAYLARAGPRSASGISRDERGSGRTEVWEALHWPHLAPTTRGLA